MTTPTDSEAVANALTALAEQMKTITTALGTANANNEALRSRIDNMEAQTASPKRFTTVQEAEEHARSAAADDLRKVRRESRGFGLQQRADCNMSTQSAR